MIDQRAASNNVSQILNHLACPQCQKELKWIDSFLICNSCSTFYPIVNEIPDLRLPSSSEKIELLTWSKHWSENNQQSLSQKFFSFYRKTVFARTVRYFVDCYFPSSGVFLEAGSGTSETSMRIDKRGGARLLVAIDIVLPILSMCHPIMDVKVCGDVFHLPFQKNSIDGIWNVGVMEHFNHGQIDQIMREFHRVLRKDGQVILLWPAIDSIPQKMLHIAEKAINFKRRAEGFHFHPEEISQLRSTAEGHDVLERNGFNTLHIDNGFRSLMAFKTLIGAKNENN